MAQAIRNKGTAKINSSKECDKNTDLNSTNMLRYPNSNKFTIHLDEVIKDVTEIELMSAYIPSSNYTISKNNRL